MSNDSTRRAERLCKHCHETLYVTAQDLRAHARVCERAAAVGLVVPSLVTPDLTIKVYDD